MIGRRGLLAGGLAALAAPAVAQGLSLGTPAAGRFTELRAADLSPRRPVPDNPVYQPPAASGTRRGVILPGGGTRIWHGFGPTEGEPRPTVLLLHGAGRDGRSMIDMWRDTAARAGLVLIAPDAGSDRGWDPAQDQAGFHAALLESASRFHPIDRSRVVLFGHSSDAIWAQLLANRQDGPWRAVATHGGSLPAAMVQPKESARPMRLYLGDRDHLFPLAQARPNAQALAQAGHAVDLVVIPGHTHWFYADGPRICAAAWEWLAAQ